MRRPNRSRVVALAAVLAVAFAVHSKGSAEQADDGGRGYTEHDWLFAGGNWSGSRYSTLADISTETIDRLGGAWVKRLDGGASSRATPVVKDGVIYLSAGANVFAIDGKTGDTIWRWQESSADAGSGAGSEVRCWSNCGRVPSWQGVGLGAGLVFVSLASAKVAALSQETGELVWVGSVGSVPRGAGESVTSAPMYARGQVFVGLASGDAGGQGRVVALDATTGEVQWSFAIIPPPGAFGHDTWPQDSDIWKIAGGGVWLVGTADPDLGMVYFPTGNPVPMYGGEAREGDNLFTASVLALDMKTGERRWHYQVVRHDVWDADIATPLLLYETEVDGQPRKALAAMRADGQLFLLDRETGEPLVEIEDRPVGRSSASRDDRDRAGHRDRERGPWAETYPRMRSYAPRRRSRSRSGSSQSCQTAASGVTRCRHRSSSAVARSLRRLWMYTRSSHREYRFRRRASRRCRSVRRPATSMRKAEGRSAACDDSRTRGS